ncbi:MAG: hypothetical protein H6732_14505 [Alphaproteobacteria bacterium]|nr:hypothetical protein [Alphaproteobacteria bacterium]
MRRMIAIALLALGCPEPDGARDRDTVDDEVDTVTVACFRLISGDVVRLPHQPIEIQPVAQLAFEDEPVPPDCLPSDGVRAVEALAALYWTPVVQRDGSDVPVALVSFDDDPTLAWYLPEGGWEPGDYRVVGVVERPQLVLDEPFTVGARAPVGDLQDLAGKAFRIDRGIGDAHGAGGIVGAVVSTSSALLFGEPTEAGLPFEGVRTDLDEPCTVVAGVLAPEGDLLVWMPGDLEVPTQPGPLVIERPRITIARPAVTPPGFDGELSGMVLGTTDLRVLRDLLEQGYADGTFVDDYWDYLDIFDAIHACPDGELTCARVRLHGIRLTPLSTGFELPDDGLGLCGVDLRDAATQADIEVRELLAACSCAGTPSPGTAGLALGALLLGWRRRQRAAPSHGAAPSRAG